MSDPRIVVDPRIFEQIAALPCDAARAELKALAEMARLGLCDATIGERAALELDRMAEAERAELTARGLHLVEALRASDAKRPPTLTRDGDGFWVFPDGRRACEECWEPIPPYRDFLRGLTAPDSDGDLCGNMAKRRPSAVEGKDGVEALRRAVCLPCYRTVFARVYAGVPPPDLDATSLQTIPPPEAPIDGGSAPDPLAQRVAAAAPPAAGILVVAFSGLRKER